MCKRNYRVNGPGIYITECPFHVDVLVSVNFFIPTIGSQVVNLLLLNKNLLKLTTLQASYKYAYYQSYLSQLAPIIMVDKKNYIEMMDLDLSYNSK